MSTSPPLKMFIRADARHTRLWVHDDGGLMFHAWLPPAPAHPRALLTLGEGLAMWWNRSVHAVVDVVDAPVASGPAPRWDATFAALRRTPLVSIQLLRPPTGPGPLDARHGPG
jgi:hypothetical protein